jgi:hypothetical protein
MLTMVGAYIARDPMQPPLDALQDLFWGGGHILQFAATAGMLAGWLLLLHEVLGTSAMNRRAARWAFATLVLPTTIGPWLAAARQSPRAFTWMMEFGIAPAVIIVMITGARALIVRSSDTPAPGPMQRIALTGLLGSGAMTLIGFWLGASISGNTTLTPAHYHVNIGAVTVTFMTLLLVLLPKFGASLTWPRTAQWQPSVYGVGQTLFAGGLALAGFWGGAARKIYGVAEKVTPPLSRIGFLIAGIGGVLALLGGVTFVAIVVHAWFRAGQLRCPADWPRGSHRDQRPLTAASSDRNATSARLTVRRSGLRPCPRLATGSKPKSSPMSSSGMRPNGDH